MNPQYVVLDTGIWLDFLRDVEGEKMLSIIEELQTKNIIKLLVPPLVEEEWKNNYSNHVQPRFERNLMSTAVGLAQTIYDSSNQLRRGVVTRVERLFSTAIRPVLSDKVKAAASDRRISRLAPFHNKKDSTLDSLIYYSSVEWCIGNQITEVFFITKNTTDFSDPTDNKKLHPDLAVLGLEVAYYVYLNMFLSKVDPDWSKRLHEKKHDEVIILPELVSDEPILDQWGKALEYYYRHLSYIPRRLMSRLYPMCNSNRNPIGHYDKGIYINNEAVIDYLSTVVNVNFNAPYDEAGSGISKEDFDKTVEIFRAINQAHIHEFRVHRPDRRFKCLINREPTCSCVRCRFRQLRLAGSMDALLPEPTEDIQENLRQGYIRFLIKDYILSAKFFYKVYQHAKEKKLPVIQLSMAQNIKKLPAWIKNFYKADDAYLEIEKLKVEDVDKLYAANMQIDSFVVESSKLIYQRHFFLTVQSQIIALRNDIAAHYESQLSGGYPSNTNLNHLFFTFAELRAFYEANSVIINRNNEAFQDLYTYVAESYLMCHQFNKGQSSRLNHFSDYWILEMVLYTRPADLRKLFTKYNLKTLRYHYDADSSETVNVTIELLADLPRFADFKSAEDDQHHLHSFTGNYYNYVSNLLFLNSFLMFTEEDNKRVAEAIVQVVRILDEYPRTYKDVYGIILYLSEKYTAFTQENLAEIIHHSFKGNSWQKDDWLQQLGDCLSEKRSTVLEKNFLLSEQVYEYITTLSGDETLETKVDYLVSWYDVLHPQHKVLVNNSINQRLREQFSPELYYQAVIYQLYDYREFYQTYIDAVAPPSLEDEDTQESRLFSTYERLGDLLNLAFRLNLPTTGEEFDKFRNRRDYYDWLMDLEHFDYSRFDINWVVKYQTRFYLKRIFESKTCSEQIRRCLMESPNAYIASLYLKYTT